MSKPQCGWPRMRPPSHCEVNTAPAGTLDFEPPPYRDQAVPALRYRRPCTERAPTAAVSTLVRRRWCPPRDAKATARGTAETGLQEILGKLACAAPRWQSATGRTKLKLLPSPPANRLSRATNDLARRQGRAYHQHLHPTKRGGHLQCKQECGRIRTPPSQIAISAEYSIHPGQDRCFDGPSMTAWTLDRAPVSPTQKHSCRPPARIHGCCPFQGHLWHAPE